MPNLAQDFSQNGPLGTNCEIGQPPPETPINQAIIQTAFNRWKLQGIARNLLPEERVSDCLRVPRAASVEIWQSIKDKKSFYGALVTCGSVWHCPVCAAKISERRGKELSEAFEVWTSNPEQTVHMLTLTVPHYFRQSLQEVVEKFMRARFLFRNRKTFKRIMKRMGLKGSINGLEVTFGQSGWHVHTHELLFLVGLTDGLKGELLLAWQKAVVDAGLGMPNDHGLNLKRSYSPSEYLAKFGKDRKWGPEQEMTKSHIKRGRDKNFTPWDLLASAGSGNQDHGKRFQEYALNFKGRHQLEWSKGLRDLLGLGPAETDQEIAERKDEIALLLGVLNYREQFKVVVQHDKRFELLQAADAGGWDAVLSFIQNLVKRSG